MSAGQRKATNDTLDELDDYLGEDSDGHRLAEFLMRKNGGPSSKKSVFAGFQMPKLQLNVKLKPIEPTRNLKQNEIPHTENRLPLAERHSVAAANVNVQNGKLVQHLKHTAVPQPMITDAAQVNENVPPPSVGINLEASCSTNAAAAAIPVSSPTKVVNLCSPRSNSRRSAGGCASDRLRRTAIRRRSQSSGRRQLLPDFEDVLSQNSSPSSFHPEICSTPTVAKLTQIQTAPIQPTIEKPPTAVIAQPQTPIEASSNVQMPTAVPNNVNNLSIMTNTEEFIMNDLQQRDAELRELLENALESRRGSSQSIVSRLSSDASACRTYTVEKGGTPGQVVLTPVKTDVNLLLSPSVRLRKMDVINTSNMQQVPPRTPTRMLSENTYIAGTPTKPATPAHAHSNVEVYIPETQELSLRNVRHATPNKCHASPSMCHASPNVCHASPNMCHASPSVPLAQQTPMVIIPVCHTPHCTSNSCTQKAATSNVIEQSSPEMIIAAGNSCQTTSKKDAQTPNTGKTTGLAQMAASDNKRTPTTETSQMEVSAKTRLTRSAVKSPQENPENSEKPVTPHRVTNKSIQTSLESAAQPQRLQDIMTDDESSDDVNGTSALPLNLAPSGGNTTRTRRLRKRSHLRQKANATQLHCTEGAQDDCYGTQRVLNLRQRDVKAYTVGEHKKRVRQPLNKAPNTPINGEKFALELARLTNYEILDLRKRNSLGKIFPLNGRKSPATIEQVLEYQIDLEERLQVEIQRRNLKVHDTNKIVLCAPPGFDDTEQHDNENNAYMDEVEHENTMQTNRTRATTRRRCTPPMSQELILYMNVPKTMENRRQTSTSRKRQLYTKGDSESEEPITSSPEKRTKLRNANSPTVRREQPSRIAKECNIADTTMSQYTPRTPIKLPERQSNASQLEIVKSSPIRKSKNGFKINIVPPPPASELCQTMQETAIEDAIEIVRSPPVHMEQHFTDFAVVSPPPPRRRSSVRRMSVSLTVPPPPQFAMRQLEHVKMQRMNSTVAHLTAIAETEPLANSAQIVDTAPTTTDDIMDIVPAPLADIEESHLMETLRMQTPTPPLFNNSKLKKHDKNQTPSAKKEGVATNPNRTPTQQEICIEHMADDMDEQPSTSRVNETTKTTKKTKRSSTMNESQNSQAAAANNDNEKVFKKPTLPPPRSKARKRNNTKRAETAEETSTNTEHNTSTLRRSKREHVPPKDMILLQELFQKTMEKNQKELIKRKEKIKSNSIRDGLRISGHPVCSSTPLFQEQFVAPQRADTNVEAKNKRKNNRKERKNNAKVQQEHTTQQDEELTLGVRPLETLPESENEYDNDNYNYNDNDNDNEMQPTTSAKAAIALAESTKKIKKNTKTLPKTVAEKRENSKESKKHAATNEQTNTNDVETTTKKSGRKSKKQKKKIKEEQQSKQNQTNLENTIAPPINEINTIFDQLKAASFCENSKQTVEKDAPDKPKEAPSISNKEQQLNDVNDTSNGTQMMENVSSVSAGNELIAWLKGVCEHQTNGQITNDVFTNMHILPAGNLTFTDLEGIDYAFYNTEQKASLGYMRFKPKQVRPPKRAKTFHLHFIVLSGEFRIGTNTADGAHTEHATCRPGDMVVINKGSRYTIENLSNDISILIVIKK